MEVVELLAGDGQAQVVGDVLAVERVAAGREAGRLVAAAAHTHDNRLGVAGDDRAAGHMEAHRAADLVVLHDDVGHHGVVGVFDVLRLEHGLELGAAVMLGIRLAVAREVVLLVVAGLGRTVVLIEDAPVAQALVGALRLLEPDLVPVHVADVLAAVVDAGAQRVEIIAHLRVRPAMGARPRAQAGVARMALIDHDDLLAGVRSRSRSIQARKAAADDQHVAGVFRLFRRSRLGDGQLARHALRRLLRRLVFRAGRKHHAHSRQGAQAHAQHARLQERTAGHALGIFLHVVAHDTLSLACILPQRVRKDL